jgi:hemin uptake protein HemP
MSPSKATALAIGAAVLGFSLGVSGLATAQFGMSGPGSQLGMPQFMRAESSALVELGNNEGIFVNKSTFKVHLGKPKATVPSDALKKGAHEVANGGIIVRHDGKLYLVDAEPEK